MFEDGIYRFANVPPEVYAALYEEIERLDMECADNFRFALADDDSAVQVYEELCDRGCCGSYDNTTNDDQGRLWLIGCNYGH